MAQGNEEIRFASVASRLLHKLAEPGAFAAARTVLGAKRDMRISIGLLLEQQAALRPTATAIKSRDQQWSWDAFNRWCNRTADFFAREGLVKGDVIALDVGNRPETLVVACAAAKLGLITAMINTSQTGEVLAHSLGLVKPRLLVVGEEQLPCFDSLAQNVKADHIRRLLFVGESAESALPTGFRNLAQETAQGSEANRTETQDIQLKDACFYIFTSGTTGLPKASVMTHYRWYRSAVSMGQLTMSMRPDDVFYCCLPFYHNNALTLGLGSVIVSGAAMAIGVKFSASRFWDDIRHYQATTFCYIGEILRYLHNQPPRADDRNHRVRAILGNGLRPDIWDAFKQRFGIARIHEFYGSSEGTNGFLNFFNYDKTCGFSHTGWALVAYDIDADEPLLNARGYLQKLGKGATGLLLTEVSEKTPFDGYTQKDASEKKLFRNVFKRGDCWFNTGDLMRSQGCGHVQFVDRVGDTFRWQGENVATTQVEAVASAWPQLEDAVVYGVKLPGRDGRCGMLSATLREGESLDARGFAEHLCQGLPRYAVPRFLRLRTTQELTATFKHQKAQLKAQGYDPAKVSEPLWILAVDAKEWRPLTPELCTRIEEGSERV